MPPPLKGKGGVVLWPLRTRTLSEGPLNYNIPDKGLLQFNGVNSIEQATTCDRGVGPAEAAAPAEARGGSEGRSIRGGIPPPPSVEGRVALTYGTFCHGVVTPERLPSPPDPLRMVSQERTGLLPQLRKVGSNPAGYSPLRGQACTPRSSAHAFRGWPRIGGSGSGSEQDILKPVRR